MAVTEPELLAVVMEELHHAKPERLPARQRRNGQRRPVERPHQGNRAVVHEETPLTSASPSAKRASAGRGWTKSARRSTSCNLSRRSTAMAASSPSAPDSRADLRQ